MLNKKYRVQLEGTAIAKVKFKAINEKGAEIYSSLKIACIHIGCDAIKHCEYDSYEVYTIDNSFYEYSDDDIYIIDNWDLALIDTNELGRIDKLAKSKDIDTYITKKKALEPNHYPLEAEKIIKIYEYDLEEVNPS